MGFLPGYIIWEIDDPISPLCHHRVFLMLSCHFAWDWISNPTGKNLSVSNSVPDSIHHGLRFLRNTVSQKFLIMCPRLQIWQMESKKFSSLCVNKKKSVCLSNGNYVSINYALLTKDQQHRWVAVIISSCVSLISTILVFIPHTVVSNNESLGSFME